MPVIQHKPVTPSSRFYLKNKTELSRKRPERSLTKGVHRKKGRNAYGRITSRRRGGGHKRLYRVVDFRRNKHGVPAKVAAIHYDPHRNARLALLFYADGEKRYILAPAGVQVGQTVVSGPDAPVENGNAMPLPFP